VDAFFNDYLLFLAKVATLAFVVLIVLAAAGVQRRLGREEGVLRVRSLNGRYRAIADVLARAVLRRGAYRAAARRQKRELRASRRGGGQRRRVFVLGFRGDLRASAVASLREEITALLSQATPGDEVVLCLENAGGTVHDHGLAASQLVRLRDRDISLTVIIDKVAASGGYMMACIANRILAAPFAIVGSIGVLAQLPNFHRLLDRSGVDFEQITAGEHKRTLTVFGENTEEGRAKMRAQVEDVHALFKEMIGRFRPQVDLERVATGEYWYAARARELDLVDDLVASDEYLLRASEDADLYEVRYQVRTPLRRRISLTVQQAFERALAAFSAPR